MVKNRLLTLLVISTIILVCLLPNLMGLPNQNNPSYINNHDPSFDKTIIWMSDTQYYSEKYPHIFSNITDWITSKQDALNISYVIHTGDIVDNFEILNEWINASKCIRPLDKARIPYGVLAGNHDNGIGSFHLFYNLFFGRWRLYKNGFFSGSILGNQNHYDLFSIKNSDFIILYLSFGISSFEFSWADAVLKQHADRNAIIAIHAYIDKEGDYILQGEEIFNRLVVPNDNVFMVLCGHKHDVELNTKTIDNRTVYEILANYQSEPLGGNGYIRLLHFSTQDQLLYVKTYSPYLDDYNCHSPEDDEFILDLNLS